MTDVLLFHHAQGLTEGVRSFADELRAAGHTVVVPDFYDGRRFATLDEGMAYAGEIGFDQILERNVAAPTACRATSSMPGSRWPLRSSPGARLPWPGSGNPALTHRTAVASHGPNSPGLIGA